MAATEPDRTADAPHPGASLLSRDQVTAINRFPDDNPNPVLRMDDDGHLIYANPSSAPIRAALGIEVGDRVPAEARERFAAVAADHGFVEIAWDNRTYA